MESIDQLLASYHDQGYVILRDVLDDRQIEATRAALQPYLDLGMTGRNDFEGERTQRVYSLVGRGREFEVSAEHPLILALLDRLLQPGYLLTASQAICIHPGETPQPLHSDDPFYTVPRPRPAISVSTIWALDDFTAISGGTEVLPGSHVWSDDEVASLELPGLVASVSGEAVIDDDGDGNFGQSLEAVEMSAGSLVLFAGTLLHRGGHNGSHAVRRAFSHQYCEPWGRQQENFMLSIPRDRAKSMSPRLRQLLGYSIHPPFMGQIAGRHPQKLLADGYVNSLVADDDAIARSREVGRTEPDQGSGESESSLN
jgi:ectoine hydroxylase-related dioxygenase (phytanoyl-CoA dioxygenase family)